MALVMVGSFGKDTEGIITYRVNGDKDDLLQIIDEAKKMGFKFWEKPMMEELRKNTFTVLLRLYVPKDLGYPEESSNA